MILAEAIAILKERLENIYSKEETEVLSLMLFQHYFKIDRLSYYTSREAKLPNCNIKPFFAALEKLCQYCPIQYILGSTTFYGLTFKLDDSVLIPRPETEELVDWIYKDHRVSNRLSILDIGTGSGAIAVSLAKSIPTAAVTAIDSSASAIKTAQSNAALNNANILFLNEDIFSPSAALAGGKAYDIIVSNPPYVLESEKELMNPNVLEYEPPSALFVPNDNPLIFYKAIALFASQHLAYHGYIYLEINEELAAETMAIFPEEVYTATLRVDMNNKNRMLKLKKF